MANHDTLQVLSLDQIKSVCLPLIKYSVRSSNPNTTLKFHRNGYVDPIRPTLIPIEHRTLDSYIVIPGFLAADETDALLARSRQLLDEFSLQDHPLVRLLDHVILVTT